MLYLILAVAVVIGLVAAFVLFHFFGIWIQAWASGAHISLITLACM